ncbi:hypothetical protein ACP275_02G132300 [Erythranthe tilingii]
MIQPMLGDKILMTIGTIAAIGNGLSQPIIDDPLSQVSKVSLKFIYLAFGCRAAAFLQVFCWITTGERQSARIRSLYLQTILQQEIAYFDQEVSTGEVIERMSSDTILIQDAIGEKVGNFVQVVSSFLGGFVIAFVKGWLLTLVMLISIPLIVISSGVMYSLGSKIASRAEKSYSNAANVVQQTIGSIRTVASFTGEKQTVAKYKKFLDASYKSDLNVCLSSGLGTRSLVFIVFSSFALAVWFGANMILHNGYTGGEVITVLLAVIIGATSLGQAAPPLTSFAAGQASAIKMFETINRKPTIDAYDTKGKILNDTIGDIELRDVCFSYPARPKEPIFDGFSLIIPSGNTAALVGQSGSGKSTVISLIEIFYDPLAGVVLIDGIDLREFQLKWIRSKIGLVSQEPVLFAGIITENIAYGKDGATLEDIREAAKLANAIDFIDKLPKGLDTMVGENGIQLSGGQKQRVAIARAIVKNPRILLLDEATSALDADSERIVQEALEKVMVERTTVIVAHRLSTVRNANMTAVLHNGKIVEKGTHNELLKYPQGVYSKLIHLQQANEDSDDKHKADISITISFGKESSQRISSMHSLSSGSSMGVSENALINESPVSSEISKGLAEVSIFRLAYFNKAEAPVLIAGVISAIIVGAILPIFGLILSGVIKAFLELPHKLKKDSEFWALMFVILGVVSLIAYPSKTHLFGIAGNKSVRQIRLICFEKVINMEIGWFDEPENSSGVIVGDALALVVENASALVIGLAIAFEACWQLAFIVLAMVPLIFLNGYAQMNSIKGFSRDAKLMYEKASQVVNDVVDNIRTIASGIGFGLSVCFMYVVYATSFYAGARFVQDGKTTSSNIFRVFFTLTLVSIAISASSSLAPDSTKAKIAANSVFAVLERKSKIDPSEESGMTLENIDGEIQFEHVNFSYPIRPGVQVLKNFSLAINNGKVLALVGESGSGKSTVISLLQRFYDPDSGYITLDGIEIHKFQLKWLRQQMGLVSQGPILFNDTIRANIAIRKGGGSATKAEIIAAAKLANAHSFICGLQQGYDTMVGEHGVQLSGGQKQRVVIARAIVKSPKILLLDEATSALDSESEKIVQEALDKVMLDRTTIVVAHRLSTTRGADVIAVLKNGSIVEKGNHHTLINVQDGFYSSL